MGTATGKLIYESEDKDIDLANQVVIEYIKNDNGPIAFQRSGKSTALSTKLGVRGFTILSIEEDGIINEIERIRKSGKDSSIRECVEQLEETKVQEFINSLRTALADYSKIGLDAKGEGFEKLLVEMLNAYGYNAEKLSKKIGGSGIADIDILAVMQSPLGDEFTTALYIQAKHYQGISADGMEQLLSFKQKNDMEAEENGIITLHDYTFNPDQIKYLLISTGDFPEDMKATADDENIICINGERLAMILYNVLDKIPDVRKRLGFVQCYQHYRKLDN